VVDLCFDDLDGLNTLKHCEKCSETWNLGPWFSSYGQKPFHGHACQFGNILGIQEPLTSKLLRIWGCSLLPWIKHHKTMWFQQKNIHFGSVVHKLCPKHPNFAGLGQKWDWPITSQETTFWVMWVLFMDLEHQNNVICTFRHPFLVYGSGFIAQLPSDPERVQPTQMWVS